MPSSLAAMIDRATISGRAPGSVLVLGDAPA
jgi:hypothetical protein